MESRVLDYLALGLFIMISITLVYAIIFIHDIPYEIAKKRKHPHQDAIHTAGWVSLFLLHTIWPFLWVWATLYKPDVGWGMETVKMQKTPDMDKQQSQEIAELKSRLAVLEKKLGQSTREA